MDGDVVEVYLADVGWLQDRHVTLVDSVESARASQLRRSGDRRRFLAGAVLLRLAVANRLGAQPADLLLDRRCRVCSGPHGLPLIRSEPLRVSVTHSADRVGVALSARGPVALDLERITRIDIAALLPLVLAAGEQDRVSTLAQFYRLWVAKAGSSRRSGVGLRVPALPVRLGSQDDVLALLVDF